jgi:hypothetical protein
MLACDRLEVAHVTGQDASPRRQILPKRPPASSIHFVRSSPGPGLSEQGFGRYKHADPLPADVHEEYARIAGNGPYNLPIGLIDPQLGSKPEIYARAHHHWAQNKPERIAELFLSQPGEQLEEIIARYQLWLQEGRPQTAEAEAMRANFESQIQAALARQLVLRKLFEFMRNQIFHANKAEASTAAWLKQYGLEAELEHFHQKARLLSTRDQIHRLARKIKGTHDQKLRARAR